MKSRSLNNTAMVSINKSNNETTQEFNTHDYNNYLSPKSNI